MAEPDNSAAPTTPSTAHPAWTQAGVDACDDVVGTFDTYWANFESFTLRWDVGSPAELRDLLQGSLAEMRAFHRDGRGLRVMPTEERKALDDAMARVDGQLGQRMTLNEMEPYRQAVVDAVGNAFDAWKSRCYDAGEWVKANVPG